MIELIKKIKEVEEARFLIAAKKPEGLEILRNTYHLAFGEYYTENCSPCHEKAYFKLMQILNNPNKYQEMSNRKFLLKSEHQVQIFGGDVYTNANLTDDVAIELLKENPKRASSFEIINGNPAQDWDGQFAEDSSVKGKKNATISETIKLIEEAKTIEELEAIIAGDERKGIEVAVTAKREELSKATQDFHILTQADIDEDPSLTEQGFKIGDKVKVTEE